MQVLLFSAIVLVICLRNMYACSFLGILFLININIYALMKSKYEINIDLVIIIQNILQISKVFSKKEKVIGRDFEKYVDIISDLIKPMSLISGRHLRKYTADFMEICAMYITGAFLFDFVLYNWILTKLKKNVTEIYSMLDLLGELDMAISIASFRKSLPLYCLPEFCKEDKIDYQKAYNPLLDSPVYNDISLDKNCIITGSNASGKSTFIKAIAVNEILAMSIHTCTAGQAVIPKARIYTSMAIKDDLLAGESYFVKEIKSIKRIIEAIEQGGFVIAIIDEILRGTNTRERISASAAILNYLSNKKCMVIVASHDIELISLLRNDDYANFYFCEKVEKKKIMFDYKIHQGICNQQNAINLLAYFGFPSDIIENANIFMSRV